MSKRIIGPVLLVSAAFALMGCSTVPVFVSDYQVYNGGDRGKRAKLSGSTVDNMGPTQAAVFYRGKGQEAFHVAASNRTEVDIGQIVQMKTVKAEPIPRLVVTKYAQFYQLDRTQHKGGSVPFSYSINFQSIGSAKIEEIVFVDALPDRFSLKEVQLFWTGYAGAARYKDDGFDQLVWETKEKDGANYLIVKFAMQKKPLGSVGSNDIITIRLDGTMNLTK
jgi:hypothetical protein